MKLLERQPPTSAGVPFSIRVVNSFFENRERLIAINFVKRSKLFDWNAAETNKSALPDLSVAYLWERDNTQSHRSPDRDKTHGMFQRFQEPRAQSNKKTEIVADYSWSFLNQRMTRLTLQR